MHEQGANVVYEKRIEQLRDFLFVGKLEGAFKGDPDTLEVHGANLDDMTDFFALEDAVATTTGHASDVEQLGAVDHVVICNEISKGNLRAHKKKKKNTIATRYADALGLDLEAQTALVFPQSSRDTRFGAWGSDLAGGIDGVRLDVGRRGGIGRACGHSCCRVSVRKRVGRWLAKRTHQAAATVEGQAAAASCG